MKISDFARSSFAHNWPVFASETFFRTVRTYLWLTGLFLLYGDLVMISFSLLSVEAEGMLAPSLRAFDYCLLRLVGMR